MLIYTKLHFDGKTSTAFVDRKEFSGSILKQLTDAYDYLKLNNKKHGTYEGLSRIDSNDYDNLVLREALLNAIIHRDYSVSGSIIINIYTDRVEFVSIGGLVPGISIDDIMIGISQSRNEKLANIFYRLELVESCGTGIKKMMESYEKTSALPIFRATSGAFLLILPNRNRKGVVEKSEELIKEEEQDDREILILNLMQEHKILSRKEIQDKLNLKQTSCI